MTNYHKYRMSPDAAYESFNDFEDLHFIVERYGLAYETIVDDDLNEVAVWSESGKRVVVRTNPLSLVVDTSTYLTLPYQIRLTLELS